MRIAECGVKTLLRPKGQKDLVKEPAGFDDGFLTERGAQTRFKPGLLGPGDVKLKRVALKVRRMIEKLQPNWPRFVTCLSRIMGRPLMDLNETVMTSSLSIHHRPATALTANC
jgi:hypothetical protein